MLHTYSPEGSSRLTVDRRAPIVPSKPIRVIGAPRIRTGAAQFDSDSVIGVARKKSGGFFVSLDKFGTSLLVY